MAAKSCAFPNCGAGKNHGIHSRFHPEHHEFMDPTKVGLQPMSAGKRAYLKSDEHKEAYGVAEAYCVGHALDAPGRCYGPLTPHHTLKRSVGGQEFAERNAPVVTLCSTLNDAIESDPATREWALTTTFERAGVSYPFLVLAKDIARG